MTLATCSMGANKDASPQKTVRIFSDSSAETTDGASDTDENTTFCCSPDTSESLAQYHSHLLESDANAHTTGSIKGVPPVDQFEMLSPQDWETTPMDNRCSSLPCFPNFLVLMFQFEFSDRPDAFAMIAFKPNLVEASTGIAAHAEELKRSGCFTQLPPVPQASWNQLFLLANLALASLDRNYSQLPHRFAVFKYECDSGKCHSKFGGCAMKSRCPGIVNEEKPCRLCHEEACVLLNTKGKNKRPGRREQRSTRRIEVTEEGIRALYLILGLQV